MYKIVSDSACDLSKEYLEKHDVTIVPLSVSFDGETYYRDGVDITRHECYQRMVWSVVRVHLSPLELKNSYK